MDLGLQGKRVLVTGGASGLGAQLSRTLVAEGAKVAINFRSREGEAQALVSDLSAENAVAIRADLSVRSEVNDLFDRAVSAVGGLDILVNTAGASWGAPAEDHPLAAWDKVMNLNVRGYFLLSQAIARHSMIPRRGGRIINVASIAGLAGNPFAMKTIAYNTSKGAVLNFTRARAGEWGAHGINVNAICPGFFKTKMATVLIETMGEEKMAAQAPLRRLGDDEDLKGITLLYASDAGKHITGQWLAVDGGVSAILGG